MKERIISAVVAMGIFLPLVWIGGLPFVILTYMMATIGLFELLRMKKQPVMSGQSLLSFVMLWVILLPNEYFQLLFAGAMTKMEIVYLAVLLILSYTVVSKNRFTFDNAGFSILSALYVGVGFYFLIATREAGLIYLFYVLFVIWGTDSGAYFIGKSLGKRKLWPVISPNKTIGGSIGGIVVAIVVALLFSVFADMGIPTLKLLFVTVLLSMFGQMGDLVQSAFKRHYGVKDAGKLIPGHGGILDRCDSWLFVLPLIHILQII
ncbi:phosphatidate cytidylyltransferase [Siminovitchia sp. FSL H7-0308]|uniref:Phosphatidate cytidylyltransferase n=1 Tax=Siminovitchia thermophila TaxID=1245522 RepID=A0ABS2R9W6_9BACI|nr:phosphatidate cytidylyltransferase [Siminovitchia thermophila]MBM7716453.1 phosphatidate cytidylyltransferase [Siminovitchia thermophila]ONK23215.1 phosphatidate cytidylyltransferase [Bacillus sp. VT-16-64]